MIIDIHCHYTTEPQALHTFRDKQLAGLADPARKPAAKSFADLGISDQTLRNWVKAAAAGKLVGAGSKVVTPEAMELARLRVEVARLKRENEIIKKAAAYFARDVL